MKKRIVSFVSLLMCAVLLCSTAFAANTSNAAEFIDEGRKCSLTMHYAVNGESAENAEVKLYRLAYVTEDFQYTLTAPFDASGISVNGIESQSEWDTVRTTFEGVILSEGISPYASVVTDKNGDAVFEDLDSGLYLVYSVSYTKDGFRYYFDSAVLSLPSLGDDGKWNYDITAKPKGDVQNPTGEDVEYRVLKLWEDGKNKRPENIEVILWFNGEQVRTVTLSDENNWSWSWYSEPGGKWQVTEKDVPDGYTVTVRERETTFTVINTYGNPPENPDKPGDVDTGDENTPLLYVMLMCLSGIFLMIIGLARKRRAR